MAQIKKYYLKTLVIKTQFLIRAPVAELADAHGSGCVTSVIVSLLQLNYNLILVNVLICLHFYDIMSA